MTYSGRVVWVTGASSGIGKALAPAFAREKAHLVVSARNRDALESVRHDCLRYTERCEIAPLDLTDSEGLANTARNVIAQTGKIDLLVNCGGISQRSPALETHTEVEREIMETNFFGTVILTKAVLASMVERGSGHVVAISSIAGLFGFPLRSTYAASKHALHGFFETLAMEVYRHNIRVSIVSPGRIRTDISYHARTGTGAPYGTLDPGQRKGMSPERCARKIVGGLKRGKRQFNVGRWELLMVALHKCLPRLFFHIARKVNPI